VAHPTVYADFKEFAPARALVETLACRQAASTFLELLITLKFLTIN
jgi:hypothetical protein